MKNKPTPEAIAELRKEARQYRDNHNELVTQLWKVDLALSTAPPQEKTALLEQQKALKINIESQGFEKHYQHLIEEIKAMEISLYGHTDVGGNSPFIL